MEELAKAIYESLVSLGALEDLAQQIMLSLQKEHVEYLTKVYQQSSGDKKAMAEATAQVVLAIQKAYHGAKLDYINRLNGRSQKFAKGGCASKKKKYAEGGLAEVKKAKDRFSKLLKGGRPWIKKGTYDGMMGAQVDTVMRGRTPIALDVTEETGVKVQYPYNAKTKKADYSKPKYGDDSTIQHSGYYKKTSKSARPVKRYNGGVIDLVSDKTLFHKYFG